MNINHLIAFAKKKKNETIFKVASSDEFFFENPLSHNNNGIQEYDPNDRQDQGKVFFIDLNIHNGISNEIIDELKNTSKDHNINTSNYKALTSESLVDVKYFAAKEGNYLLFQQFYKKNIIGSKILSLKKLQLLKGDFISLNKYAEVIYSPHENKIYFQSIIKAKKILSGLEAIYKEAGQKETKAFLDHQHLQISQDFNETKVNVLNKKRIQAELDKQELLKTEKGDDYLSFYTDDVQKCLEDIKNYYPDMVVEGKLLIKNNIDLERYLLALDERLYTATRSQQRRIATATRRV